jgi:hypothetical protein
LETLETAAADTEAWSKAFSMLMTFPGLRGLWTLGSYNASGEAVDQSGNGLHLTRSGVLLESATAPLAPKSFWGSASHYLSHADSSDFDLIGNESYVRSGQDFRGLTAGMWIRPNSGTGEQWAMSKYLAGGNQRSYALLLNNSSSDNAQFIVSGDGATTFSVVSSINTAVNWMFILARYRSEVPDIAVFANGIWVANSTSIPSTLFNGAAAFRIGDDDTGSGRGFTGRGSLAFLCHAAVPSNLVETFYYLSAPQYSG